MCVCVCVGTGVGLMDIQSSGGVGLREGVGLRVWALGG